MPGPCWADLELTDMGALEAFWVFLLGMKVCPVLLAISRMAQCYLEALSL